MAPYRARERQEWIEWYLQHGQQVASTCRQFGISRATFYRWLQRYDPSTPRRPLRSRSRRPRTRRRPTWTLEQLATVSDLVSQNPHWGRGRVRQLLLERYDWCWSAATVGRMLQVIRTRCPVCKGQHGEHDAFTHALGRDLRGLGIDSVAAAEAHGQQQAPMTDQASEAVAEKAAVVEAAVQIARSGRLSEDEASPET
jgi:transposase